MNGRRTAIDKVNLSILVGIARKKAVDGSCSEETTLAFFIVLGKTSKLAADIITCGVGSKRRQQQNIIASRQNCIFQLYQPCSCQFRISVVSVCSGGSNNQRANT